MKLSSANAYNIFSDIQSLLYNIFFPRILEKIFVVNDFGRSDDDMIYLVKKFIISATCDFRPNSHKKS